MEVEWGHRLAMPFLQWLANTTFSTYLRESPWAYPIVETVHVLTLCLFLGFTMLLDLRQAGHRAGANGGFAGHPPPGSRGSSSVSRRCRSLRSEEHTSELQSL